MNTDKIPALVQLTFGERGWKGGQGEGTNTNNENKHVNINKVISDNDVKCQ